MTQDTLDAPRTERSFAAGTGGTNVLRLIGAELRRLRSRRMAVITAIVLLVAVGLFQLVVNDAVSPPSAAAVAEQQQSYQQARQEWEKTDHAQAIQECLAEGETQQNCEKYTAAPNPADWALTPIAFDEIGGVAMLFGAFVSMLAAYLVSASFIGAEYTSGSLANWLTFVPQRLRVYASKLAAVVIASAVAGAVVNFLVLGLAALLTRIHGGALTGFSPVAEQAARAVILAVVAGVLGFALALVTRHTVAALGTVLGYLVVSAVLGGFAMNADSPLATVPPWLAENNVQAFLQHGHSYYQYVSTVTDQGVTQNGVEKHITFGHSAVYWLVVVVVAVVVAALVFRRRDVT